MIPRLSILLPAVGLQPLLLILAPVAFALTVSIVATLLLSQAHKTHSTIGMGAGMVLACGPVMGALACIPQRRRLLAGLYGLRDFSRHTPARHTGAEDMMS